MKYKPEIIDPNTLSLNSANSLGNINLSFHKFCKTNGYEYQIFHDDNGLGNAILLKLNINSELSIYLGTREDIIEQGFEIEYSGTIDDKLDLLYQFTDLYKIDRKTIEIHPQIIE